LIIAIKEKDKVVIARSNLDRMSKLTDMDYVDEENSAIKFGDNGYVYAASDMSRYSDVLFYDDEFFNLEISPKNIVKEVIPYMKEIFNDKVKPDAGDKGWKNALVICDNEHIYDIDPNYLYCEKSEYVCHGYKEADVIISILDSTTSLSAEERIIKAVSFASKLFKETLFPIIITDTKSKNLRIVQEGEGL
jgi:hypothetical protein